MTHIYYKNYHENVYYDTLKNGINIVVLPNQHVKTTYVALALPFGASHLMFRDGEKEILLPEGSAHFFEHKIFASKHGDMFSKFVQLGLDPNAMTTYDTTSYYFSSTKHIYEGIDLLFDLLDEAYFTDANIESERHIINEEIHMDLDDVMTPLYQQLYRNMYAQHPIKSDILGTIESIANIDKKTLSWIHQNIYQDDRKTLFISGNVDIDVLRVYLDKKNNEVISKTRNIEFVTPNEDMKIVKSRDEVVKDMTISRLLLGIKLPHQSDEIVFHKMKQSIYMTLHVLIGEASDIHQTWIEKGFIHQSVQFQITHLKYADHVTIHVPTNYPDLMLADIEKALEQDIAQVLTYENFLRLKKVMTAANIMSLDHNEHKMFQYMSMYFKGISLYDVMDALHALEYEDVIRYGNEFKTFSKSVLIARKKD